MPNRNLIDITDLTPAEIDGLISTAEDIIENPAKYQNLCAHQQLATLFFEPSTRTRLSFESAMGDVSEREMFNTYNMVSAVMQAVSGDEMGIALADRKSVV